MASSDSAPLIDSRSEEDIVAQTTALVASYTGPSFSPDSQWSPQARDLGTVLIRVFARMMSQVIQRLNQVPENNHLAFLGLLGAQQLPPRPARVPLTFQPVEGASVQAVVPAGTPVAAPADGPFAEAVFTTESEMIAANAQLAAVFVHRPATDTFADCTDIATGAASGTFVAFTSPTSIPTDSRVPHWLFIGHDLLSLRAGEATVTATVVLNQALDDVGEPKLDKLKARLIWTRSAANQWSTPVDYAATTADGETWQLTLQTKLPFEMQPVANQPAQLRAEWDAPILPGAPAPVTSISAITLKVDLLLALPTNAFSNSAALDVTKDFLPFGDRFKLGDAFYVTHPDALQPHAMVTVSVTMSEGWTSTTNPVDPTVTWEAWNGQQWSPLGVAGNGISSSPGAVQLPGQLGITSINGVAGKWLRARIDSIVRFPVPGGNRPVPIPYLDYTPPSVKAVTLSYSATAPLTKATVQNGFTPPTSWESGQAPFTALPDSDPAVYFGFKTRAADSVPFTNQVSTLYLQVDPPTPDEVQAREDEDNVTVSPAAQLLWEYRGAGSTWNLLPAADETTALIRSGLLRFVGPTDLTSSKLFGGEYYWIRGRMTGVPQLERRLLRTSLDTVWASHLGTTTNETLGSGTGTPDQTFTLSQVPVLLGQRIELNEGQLPPADEIAALTAIEGADAITVVPAAAGTLQQVWVRWHEVPDFYGSGPADRHYVMDHFEGIVRFGDGTNGSVPRAGVQIRAARYQWGGGSAGNRAANTVTQLRRAIPYLQSVTNHEAAAGGADAETLARLKERTSHILRHRGRAVTVEDFEDIALQASPAVARALAVPPTFHAVDQAHGAQPDLVQHRGKVLLIVVPSSPTGQPVPSPELLNEVEDYVRARCAPAVTLQVTGPRWAEITVTASLAISALGSSDNVLADVDAAIRKFLHPLTGGHDGTGWEFGEQPHDSDFYLLFSQIAGIDHVASLAIRCEPRLQVTSDDLAVLRELSTYLIYSAAKHTITLAIS